MANLQVKNVPEDIHAELRRRAELRGVTLREYVLDLLRRDQARPSKEEWLRHHQTLPRTVLDRPIDELIREDREQRTAHLESIGSSPSPRNDA